MENRLPFRTAAPGQGAPQLQWNPPDGAERGPMKSRSSREMYTPLQRAGAALDAVSADSAGRPGNRTSCFFAVCPLPAGLQFAKD